MGVDVEVEVEVEVEVDVCCGQYGHSYCIQTGCVVCTGWAMKSKNWRGKKESPSGHSP